jgi:CHAT domain-containing protein
MSLMGIMLLLMSVIGVSDLRVAAIEYFVGSALIWAVLIDEEAQSRLFPLCRVDECMAETHELLDALDGPSTPNERARLLHSFSADWGRKLLPPFEAIAEFDVLVLIPHHTLHALPLHAIRIEEQNASLGACRAVTYCSSATLFTRCVQRNAARRSDCTGWLPGDASTPPLSGPPLPSLCAGIAIDALDGKDESYLRLGELFGRHFKEWNPQFTAVRSGIKLPYVVGSGEHLPTYDAICFVCHGYYDPVRPANSGLLVGDRISLGGTTWRFIQLPGGQSGHFRDLPFRELPREIVPRPDIRAEMMTVGEIDVQVSTQAELVALLGCSTSAGHVLSGDLMQSMAYQWLKIGAASVLASLWRIDIEFISGFVETFLRNWLDFRQPKAIAFRECLKTILSAPNPPSLYQWAGIQLMGDWF